MFQSHARFCRFVISLSMFIAICFASTRFSDAAEPVHGGKTLSQWQELLKSQDPSLRWQASEAFGRMGRSNPRLVVEALVRAAGDKDLDVRLQAVVELTALKHFAEPAVTALGAALQDNDSDLRRQAAVALASVGPWAEESAPILAQALRDPNANVRLAAVGALQAIGPDATRTLDDLLVCLKDKVPSVRRATANALAVIARQADPDRTERAVRALAAALQDSDADVRLRAAVALGAIGPKAEGAAALLGEASRVPRDPASREAALALGRIGGKGTAELARNLEHADVEVRTHALLGLQLLQYKARPVLAALIKALNDADPNVRQHVMSALRSCDPEPKDVFPIVKSAVAGRADESGRLWAVAWLGEIAVGVDQGLSQEAVGVLTLALADGDARVRGQAAQSLGQVGPAARFAVKDLRALVNDSDANVRLQVAFALGSIDATAAREAIPVLIKALTQRRSRGGPPFSPDVASALAALGTVEPLVEALEKSTDEGTTAGITNALVRMGPRAKGAFKYLQGALQSRDAGVRQRSADAIQAILPDPQEAVPVLVASLQHEDDYIRRWAGAFLAELGARAPGPDVSRALEPLSSALQKETAADVRIHFIRALAEISAHQLEAPQTPLDQEMIRTLIPRLTDVNPNVRREATITLGKIGAAWKGRGPIREAMPALLDALATDRPFQAEAASALGQIGYLPPLMEALQSSKSERIRAGAGRAVTVIGPGAVAQLPSLQVALQDPDPHVRHEVVLAIGAIGRPAAAAVPDLIRALDDPDYVVPPGAAIALGQLGPEAEDAALALSKALNSPSSELRSQAQTALVAIGPRAVPALRAALKSPEPTVRVLAAQAVQRIGSKASPAIPELLQAYELPDNNVKYSVSEALTVLQAQLPAAIPALAQATAHPDVNVATSATKLLQLLKADTPVVVAALASRLEEQYKGNPRLIEFQQRLIQALGEMGPAARTATPVLLVALDDAALVNDASRALRAILGHNVPDAELVKLLRDQTQLDERLIALVLGSAGADVVPALSEMLSHKRARVRTAAAYSLERLGAKGRGSAAELSKALSDPHRQVRLNATHALSQQALGSDDKQLPAGLLDAVTTALSHWDEVTRVEAAITVAQLARRQPSAVVMKSNVPATILVESLKLEANPARQAALISALNDLAQVSGELPLLRALGDEDIQARERVLLAIGSIRRAASGEATTAGLEKSLRDRHVSLRQQAAFALSRLAQAEWPDLKAALRAKAAILEQALQDRDRSVRVSSAIALWRVTDQPQKSLPILLNELALQSYQDGELIEQIRAGKVTPEALLVLAGMAQQSGAAREALVAEFKSSDLSRRVGAAVVVGIMHDPPADVFALPLAALLEDRNQQARLQATAALRWMKLGPAQQEPVLRRLYSLLADRDDHIRRQSLTTFSALGPGLESLKLEGVLESLKDRDSSIRLRSVETLGRLGKRSVKAISDLRFALHDQDPAVRRAAAASLGQIGADSVAVLKPCLTDKDYEVRKNVASALGQIGPAAAVALPELRAACADQDEEVSAAAKAAIQLVLPQSGKG